MRSASIISWRCVVGRFKVLGKQQLVHGVLRRGFPYLFSRGNTYCSPENILAGNLGANFVVEKYGCTLLVYRELRASWCLVAGRCGTGIVPVADLVTRQLQYQTIRPTSDTR